ncbi:TetR/AcrR family transcriptional regulator [Massilia terrae]|uniref:TetR/AcrR family transcriptional regulator n=1 Tax=Massilia terrae TaxID=1811224 RepID=A0ABT2CZA1_9BURK|nr:TetR/AcrR family transcriptional regulator [Massilia terrae]
MRKSKIEAAESRKRVLATASDKFLREGINATGISDVMVAAGLTQGGFYRHFRSKEHLIAEASAAAFDDTMAEFEQAVSGKSPREAIAIIVHHYLFQLQAEDNNRLCPLSTLSSELRHSNDEVKAVILNGYSRLVKFLASFMMRLDVDDYLGLASSVVSIMVGAVSVSALAVEKDAANNILTNAEKTIGQLIDSAARQARPA